jgi:hypothetical protein
MIVPAFGHEWPLVASSAAGYVLVLIAMYAAVVVARKAGTR